MYLALSHTSITLTYVASGDSNERYTVQILRKGLILPLDGLK